MRLLTCWVWLVSLFPLVGCATTGTRLGTGDTRSETGIASYYASEHHGRLSASGLPYDEDALVAAHRTLPFGTRVRVTNLDNGSTVVLTVIDRGPFARGRILDVSRRAARELGFLRQGTARVRVEVLGG